MSDVRRGVRFPGLLVGSTVLSGTVALAVFPLAVGVPWAVCMAGLGGLTCLWALAPALVVTDEALVVRNYVRELRVPWGLIVGPDRTRVGPVVELHVRGVGIFPVRAVPTREGYEEARAAFLELLVERVPGGGTRGFRDRFRWGSFVLHAMFGSAFAVSAGALALPAAVR